LQNNSPQDKAGQADQSTPPVRPRQMRRRLMKLSALLIILLPTFATALYYGNWASNQYVVEVRFAVRGTTNVGGGDLLGMVTGIPSGGSTTVDSYILMDFIHSREIIEKLREKIPIDSIYGTKKADYLSSFDQTKPIEDFVDYWKGMTTLSFDSSSQIIIIGVRAFSPKDAKKVAEAVLELSEELINDLSAKSRKDAVSFAEKEADRMEKRLRLSRQAVRSFREKEQVIDPSKTAESRLTLLAKLEGELSIERAKLNSLSQFMSKDSPRIIVITSKINALEVQVRKERSRQGKTEGIKGNNLGALTGLLEHYRSLLVDQEFAEKAYVSALSSLELARVEAGKQQRYLAVFVHPSLPEDSLYPRRILNTFLVLVISVISWAIGTLIIYAIRDHAM